MSSMTLFSPIYQTASKPMKSISYRIVMLCWIILLISPSAGNAIAYSFDPNATCADFLRQYDPDAPDFFQYQQCDLRDDLQARPIEVLYKVEGKYAKQAEAYLIEKTGIGKLIFMCCYWGSEKGQIGEFSDPKTGLYHEVIFSSEEVLSNVDWQDVTFYLSISVFREDI